MQGFCKYNLSISGFVKQTWNPERSDMAARKSEKEKLQEETGVQTNFVEAFR